MIRMSESIGDYDHWYQLILVVGWVAVGMLAATLTVCWFVHSSTEKCKDTRVCRWKYVVLAPALDCRSQGPIRGALTPAPTTAATTPTPLVIPNITLTANIPIKVSNLKDALKLSHWYPLC
jgi:hypothetical protein